MSDIGENTSKINIKVVSVTEEEEEASGILGIVRKKCVQRNRVPDRGHGILVCS